MSTKKEALIWGKLYTFFNKDTVISGIYLCRYPVDVKYICMIDSSTNQLAVLNPDMFSCKPIYISNSKEITDKHKPLSVKPTVKKKTTKKVTKKPRK